MYDDLVIDLIYPLRFGGLMSGFSPFVMQQLESRTLLAASPFTPTAIDPQVQEHLAAVQADFKQLRADSHAAKAELAADRAAVRTAMGKLKTEMAPLTDKLKADIKACRTVLDAYRPQIRAVQEKYRPIIRADHQAIFAARGAPEALAAARVKLDTDLKAQKDELKPIFDAMQAEQAKWKDTIQLDRDAINAFRDANKAAIDEATAKLKADQQKWMEVLKKDQATLKADMEALRAHRKARG